MAKIIILKGPEKAGKSSTLRFLIGLFMNPTLARILYSEPSNLTQALHDDEDCFAVFELFNGIKVGIITWGDPGYAAKVHACVGQCLSHSCDVIVGAARSYDKPGSVFRVLYGLGSAPGNLLTVTTPFIVHNPPAHLTAPHLKLFYDTYNRAFAYSIYAII